MRPDQACVDRLLDAISDARQRDLVCRLAAAVVTADGTLAHDDRPVYHHVRNDPLWMSTPQILPTMPSSSTLRWTCVIRNRPGP